MPFATLSLPSTPATGQLNEFRRAARTIIAQDMNTGEYIEVIAWYHSEVVGLEGKAPRFSRIMDKDAAISWGYIQG